MARKVISGGITGLSYRFKSDLAINGGTATTPWYALEPNSYSDYGGQVKTVARQPLSRSRQQKKGAVVDFDASGGFNHDFTQHQLTRLLQAFFYANAFEKGTTAPLNTDPIPVTAVDSSTGYAVDNSPDLGFLIKHLVLASGFGVAANNGLKHLSAVSTSALATDTAGLVTEASPPAAAKIQVVGVEFASGDAVLDVSSDRLEMTTTVFNLTTLGLHPGEWVFIGGDAAGNQFASNVPGYARVSLTVAIASHKITFDKTTFTPADSAGTSKTIRMFFGTMIRNMTEAEITSAGDVSRFILDLERTLGRDASGIQSQVLIDAIANSLTYTQPLSDKVTADMNFVALDEEMRDGATGLYSGSRVAGLGEHAYNTSTCLFRARMSILDPATLNPSALFAYVQKIDLTLENGISAVKAQGDIGGIDTVEGDFIFGGTADVYFSTVAAVEAIRAYSDVTFDAILAQRNAGYIFDIPIMGLGNGRLAVSKDTPITVPLGMSAFENDAGYTASFTDFAYLPDAAMPVT
jgi:hypothetical protein